MTKRKIYIVMVTLAMLLTGCSTQKVSDKKENKSKIIREDKIQSEEKQTEEKNSNESEFTNNNQKQNNQNSQEIESNTTQSDTTYLNNVENNDQSINNNVQVNHELVTESQIPACDDTIPAGAYTSWAEVNNVAQNTLINTQIANGWTNGKYNVYTSQTACGTLYYTFEVMEVN